MTPPPLALFQKFIRFGSGILPLICLELPYYKSINCKLSWDKTGKPGHPTCELQTGLIIIDHAQKSKQGRDDSLQLQLGKKVLFLWINKQQPDELHALSNCHVSTNMATSHVAFNNKQCWWALSDMCVTTIMQYNSAVAFTLSTSDQIII